ncbi:MAG: DUF308 domain-containing protein [Synergistaceae bacterium]|jgi:uncharacterized membrane protein HdeD (DUF308 family)|nr:DUF308 domain-containing protein [Synergistaceae bacterium]
MADYLRTMRWTLYTTGTILIALGVVSFLHPLASLMSLAFFIGIGFVITGVNHLIPWFSMRESSIRPFWLLPQGIADLLLGGVMLARIGVTTLMIPVMLGFWVMLMAGLRFFTAFQIRRAGMKNWWMSLFSAAALLVCALVVIASPVIGALIITGLIGFAFICAGLLAIVEGRLIYPAAAS